MRIGRQEEHPACKTLSDEILSCLERGANDLQMVQLMPLPRYHLLLIKIHISLTFLVPAYPGCPGKQAVKRASVVVSRITQKVINEFSRNLGKLNRYRLVTREKLVEF